MDYDGIFFMQQTVEWSLLNDGTAITVSAIALLYYRIIYKYLLTTITRTKVQRQKGKSSSCLSFRMARS